MSHYAILAPCYTGHLNPLCALARALERRGHRVMFLSVPDAEPRLRTAGFAFTPIAATEFPEREWKRQLDASGEVTGLKATAAAGRILGLLARGILRDLPAIAAHEKFDGLIMDQICVGTESVCEVIGLPLAVACSALAMHVDSRVPPPCFPWREGPAWPFRLRNLAAQFRVNLCGLPVWREVGPYRSRHRLPAMRLHYVNEMRPSLVQVAQQPAWFDFPGRRMPDHFHYTGPWIEGRTEGDGAFPWSRLDGRPLIYASFGTVQAQLTWLHRVVVEACTGLDAQLVLALGRQDATLPSALPKNVVAVAYAPQVALLRQATLALTHAGLNTTLEALAAGVPQVAVPISNDQPGNAVRLEHIGAGRFIPIGQLTAAKLGRVLREVLASPAFRTRAQAFAADISRIDGPGLAAELIERALTTRQRLVRASSVAPAIAR